MKRSLYLLLLLLIAQAGILFAQTTDRTAAAESVLRQLKNGCGDSLYAASTPQVQGQLKAESFNAIWQQLTMQAGALQGSADWQQKDQPPYAICQKRLEFERAALIMTVTFDAEGRIAGLFFAPAPPAATPPTGSETSDNIKNSKNASPARKHASFPAGDARKATVKNGKVQLPGTLVLPQGATAERPVPAVVFVHGSGPNDRDETIGPNRLFRDLADSLAAAGIASLRYDKRTYVYRAATASISDGKLDYDVETVDDAVCAIDLLRRTAGIDPQRIYVVGHSQGAMLAPRIAARSGKAAGCVMLAAPARTLDVLLHEQLRHLAPQSGMTVAQADSTAESMWHKLPADYRAMASAYDPVAEAAALSVPMLFLQGGNDYQVTAADFSLYQETLRGNPRAHFVFLPEADHLMRPLEKQAVPADYQRFVPISGKAVVAIRDFIHQ
ncbi:MAG: alpha/beta fold hydrolase [Alloprevotella sp.]|nr:alpha/beta fold hydrolase [Alloprevotella sp.]